MEAIANALRLKDNERLHLLRLASPGQFAQRDLGPEKIRDSLLALVGSNSEQAALVVGRHMDLLGANRLGYALFGLTQGQRVNLAKQVVLEPAMRDLMVNWADQVRDVAAYLRMATTDMSNDTQLAELIGELSIKKFGVLPILGRPPSQSMYARSVRDRPSNGRPPDSERGNFGSGGEFRAARRLPRRRTRLRFCATPATAGLLIS